MPEASDHVKVRFNLPPDEGGWPAVSSEGLWVLPLGGDRYRLDNTPWFARGLAADDVVEALAGSDGVLWATRRTEWGGRMTVRVVPRRSGPLAGDLQAVLDAFAPLGVTGEGVQQYGMIALDISGDAPLAEVKSLLAAGERDGRWDYEEGLVSQEWLDL
jgi:hypothetical protein